MALVVDVNTAYASTMGTPVPTAASPTTPHHLTRFLRHAGLLAWDRATMASCRLDDDVCPLLHVVADLEADTAISAQQARSLGLDQMPDIGAFLPVWEAEEAEHAAALRGLLAHRNYRTPQALPPTISRRRRAVARVPAGTLGRFPPSAVVYCTLGAAAEFLTILVYDEIVAGLADPAAVGLLRSITRQEGRHYAFFLAAARIRADRLSRVNGHLARLALDAVWEPPGRPSLGDQAWEQVFAPMLSDPVFRARAEGMDRILDTIPHLAGLALMGRFLVNHPL